MKGKLRNVILLYSGGIDSTAALHFYKNLNYSISAVHINFGQISNRKEWGAVKRISAYYNIESEKINLSAIGKFKDGFIQGRNLFLIATAIVKKNISNGQIVLGLHSGTNYIDCSQEFLDKCNEIAVMYTGGKIKITAPFITWTKKQIFDYCIMEKVPLQLTYSCELGKMQPCDICSSCKELKALYATQNH